jgi:hypothetical protein
LVSDWSSDVCSSDLHVFINKERPEVPLTGSSMYRGLAVLAKEKAWIEGK